MIGDEDLEKGLQLGEEMDCHCKPEGWKLELEERYPMVKLVKLAS